MYTCFGRIISKQMYGNPVSIIPPVNPLWVATKYGPSIARSPSAEGRRGNLTSQCHTESALDGLMYHFAMSYCVPFSMGRMYHTLYYRCRQLSFLKPAGLSPFNIEILSVGSGFELDRLVSLFSLEGRRLWWGCTTNLTPDCWILILYFVFRI
jgi:hypothetical protein